MILLLNTELMRQSWMRRLESIQDSLRNDASPISSSQEAAARHAAAIAETSTPDGEGGEGRVPSPTATGVELLASPPLIQADEFGSRSDSHGSASGLMSGGGSAVPSPRRRRLAARPSEWVVADYVSKRHHKNVDDGGHGVKPAPAIRKLKSARGSVGGDAASVPIAEVRRILLVVSLCAYCVWVQRDRSLSGIRLWSMCIVRARSRGTLFESAGPSM